MNIFIFFIFFSIFSIFSLNASRTPQRKQRKQQSSSLPIPLPIPISLPLLIQSSPIQLEEIIPGSAQSIIHSFIRSFFFQETIAASLYRTHEKKEYIPVLIFLSKIINIINSPHPNLYDVSSLIAQIFSCIGSFNFRDSPSEYGRTFSSFLMSIFPDENFFLYQLIFFNFPFNLQESDPEISPLLVESDYLPYFLVSSNDLSLIDSPHIKKVLKKIGGFISALPDFMYKVDRICNVDGDGTNSVSISIKIPFNCGAYFFVYFNQLSERKLSSINLLSSKKVYFLFPGNIWREYFLSSIILFNKASRNSFYSVLVRHGEDMWMLWGHNGGDYSRGTLNLSDDDVSELLKSEDRVLYTGIWVKQFY